MRGEKKRHLAGLPFFTKASLDKRREEEEERRGVGRAQFGMVAKARQDNWVEEGGVRGGGWRAREGGEVFAPKRFISTCLYLLPYLPSYLPAVGQKSACALVREREQMSLASDLVRRRRVFMTQ